MGAVIGLIGGFVYWLAAQAWPTSVAMVLAMLATVLLMRKAKLSTQFFYLLLKYNALMALSAAKLPFAAPPNAALGLIMVCGLSSSHALWVSAAAARSNASPRPTTLDVGIAMLLGFTPAALIGIPGLSGLVLAIVVSIGFVAYGRRERQAGEVTQWDLTQPPGGGKFLSWGSRDLELHLKRSAMNALTAAALPLLTRLDPETAHGLGLKGLRWVSAAMPALEPPASLARIVCNLKFAHPVGLAAGFDKNGDYLDALGAAGFSHIELGTVTPRPQRGNPRPRMFRFANKWALVNRMGFNNKGVDYLVERLTRSHYKGIRGVSIGKNFDTSIERAHEDYVACLQKVYAHADYIAVNVSSPNTARLRELQEREGLQRILGTLLESRLLLEQRQGKRVPLWVKVSPDLTGEQLSALCHELRSLSIDGVIATNTSTDLALLQENISTSVQGGLSGAPIHPLSLAVIRQLRSEMGTQFPIVGVGGIVSADNARATLDAGANLIQIYTGFAYRGPALLEEVLNGLASGLQPF